MYFQRRSQHHRAFTLVEMIVVIMIIVVLASLAAGFMPRAQDSTNLSNGIDQMSQWLLTAKMRAKRDGLATGIRFIKDPNNPGFFTQFQYVQQPDPLTGGQATGNGAFNGGYCMAATPGATGTLVTFGSVDFSLGGVPQIDLNGQMQWLVQPGDYLELRDGGGVHPITVVPPTPIPCMSFYVSSAQPITLTAWTANYRILRQPRPLIGENPLQLPGNIAVDLVSADPTPPNQIISQVLPGVSGFIDILFSPSGAVVGTNAALPKVYLFVHDKSKEIYTPPANYNAAGIIAIQTQTGSIGGYDIGVIGNPRLFANATRSSGL